MKWTKNDIPTYDAIPEPWRSAIKTRFAEEDLREIREAIAREIDKGNDNINPNPQHVFRALGRTAPETVRVVIVGQDPYPRDGVADGFAFSASPKAERIPSSLARILSEVGMDQKARKTKTCWNLEHWADQGVLLLNSVLTCPAFKPWGHASIGWQKLTAAVLSAVRTENTNAVFLLWGAKAERAAAAAGITLESNLVIRTTHPVASRGTRLFRKSGVFTECNQRLSDLKQREIAWLPCLK